MNVINDLKAIYYAWNFEILKLKMDKSSYFLSKKYSIAMLSMELLMYKSVTHELHGTTFVKFAFLRVFFVLG